MISKYLKILSTTLSIPEKQILNTVLLLEEGATIPFIARYRKEKTGNLDETQIGEIKIQLNKIIELDKRRESIIKSIEDQGKMTDELKEKIEKADNLTDLEDIYLPYKPKKKTRASIARENGLEPLAKIIMSQRDDDILSKAGIYLSDKVPSKEDALQGARDIIAEWVNEHKGARNSIRRLFNAEATIKSTVVKAKKDEAIKYKDYFLGGCILLICWLVFF